MSGYDYNYDNYDHKDKHNDCTILTSIRGIWHDPLYNKVSSQRRKSKTKTDYNYPTNIVHSIYPASCPHTSSGLFHKADAE